MYFPTFFIQCEKIAWQTEGRSTEECLQASIRRESPSMCWPFHIPLQGPTPSERTVSGKYAHTRWIRFLVPSEFGLFKVWPARFCIKEECTWKWLKKKEQEREMESLEQGHKRHAQRLFRMAFTQPPARNRRLAMKSSHNNHEIKLKSARTT